VSIWGGGCYKWILSLQYSPREPKWLTA
jgi:hypothetical protein